MSQLSQLSMMLYFIVVLVGLIVPCIERTHAKDGDSYDYDCPSVQYAERNAVGYINCTFRTNCKSVYWYNDTYDSSGLSPLIGYVKSDNTRIGDGYTDGEYNISDTGSLIIHHVTTEHESTYRVVCFDFVNYFQEFPIKLIVIVYPNQIRPRIGNCEDLLCYSDGTAELMCTINGIRPPAKITWLEKILNITQQTNTSVTPNEDGTFDVSTSLPVQSRQHGVISLWTCQSHWIYPEYLYEANVIVDLNNNSLVVSTTLSRIFERYGNAEVRCDKTKHFMQIWKREYEHGSKIIAIYMGNQSFFLDNTDVLISSEGNLIFKSIEVAHEGVYKCHYSDGRIAGITSTDVTVLIQPSPPFISIDQCDKYSKCTINASVSNNLTCTLSGFRPYSMLQWSYNIGLPLQLSQPREDVQQQGDVFDVTSSVTFNVTKQVYSDQDIIITCSVEGPVSKMIVQPFVNVYVIPDQSCQAKVVDVNDTSNDRIVNVCSIVISNLIIFIFALLHWLERKKRIKMEHERALFDARQKKEDRTNRLNGNFI